MNFNLFNFDITFNLKRFLKKSTKSLSTYEFVKSLKKMTLQDKIDTILLKIVNGTYTSAILIDVEKNEIINSIGGLDGNKINYLNVITFPIFIESKLRYMLILSKESKYYNIDDTFINVLKNILE
jgi:hypothetical protein